MLRNLVELTIPANVILAKRINSRDWDARDILSSRILAGSIIIELTSKLVEALESGHLKPKDLDLDSALKIREALAYVVVDHSKTDGRPDCLLLKYKLDDQGLVGLVGPNEYLLPSDLPLVPIALLGEE